MRDPQWRWAIRWSVILVGLSCVPYIIAIFMAPEGWHFAGILVNPYDGQSYLAKMRQGFDGNWLFHLTYTPEPHEGVYIYLFYLFFPLIFIRKYTPFCYAKERLFHFQPAA